MGRGNHFLEALRSRGAHPLIIAHRGDSYSARIPWRRPAGPARPEAWELDVQLTREGVPVVIHDDSLIRTTDVATRFEHDPRAEADISSTTSTSMKSRRSTPVRGSCRNAGRPDRPESSARLVGSIRQAGRSMSPGSVRIPRLVDALRLTLELDWLVNVEIKAVPLDPPGLAAAVLDAIAETGTADRVLVSSFDHRIVGSLVGRVNARSPPGLRAPGGYSPPELPRYASEIVGCSTVHLSAECLGSGSLAYRRRPGGIGSAA